MIDEAIERIFILFNTYWGRLLACLLYVATLTVLVPPLYTCTILFQVENLDVQLRKLLVATESLVYYRKALTGHTYMVSKSLGKEFTNPSSLSSKSVFNWEHLLQRRIGVPSFAPGTSF